MSPQTQSSGFEFAGIVRTLAVIVGIGTFLAILRPYGTGFLGWPTLWFYWVGLVATGGLLAFLTTRLTRGLLAGWTRRTDYLVSVFVVSIPMTFVVVTVNTLLGMSQLGVMNTLINFFFVLVISAFVMAVGWIADHFSNQTEASDTPAPVAPSRALIDKLPHGFRTARILALKSEDHYLRMFTDKGDTLILMRLVDAIAACEGLQGARTHRSWWVLKDAVIEAQKGDGRGTFILTDKTEAPVSRTYYTALRQAGWF